MKIPKITFANLIIEITRRCNQTCIHCMRGDAQERDISLDDLSSLLAYTNGIYSLQITGGEPFLNLDALQFMIDEIKRNHIFLGQFSIITNGTIRNDAVVKVVKDFSEYIGTCVQSDIPAKNLVNIMISNDTFHVGYSVASFDWYRHKLEKYATVTKARGGEVPYKIGRAKDLEYAKPYSQETPKRIEYIAPDHEPICRMKKHYKSFFNNQITVLCSLYVTACGKVIDSIYDQNTFEDIDNCEYIFRLPIQSPVEIMKAIWAYNESKPYCVESNGPRIEYDIFDLVKKHPNPEEAKKCIQANLLFVNKDFLNYNLLFGNKKIEQRDIPDLATYINVYLRDLPNKYSEKEKEYQMTQDEERELLFKALSQYGDYREQAIKAEREIRQAAVEKVMDITLSKIVNPLGFGGLDDKKIADAKAAMREHITVEAVAKLSNEEMTNLYLHLADVEGMKKLAATNDDFAKMADSAISQLKAITEHD